MYLASKAYSNYKPITFSRQSRCSLCFYPGADLEYVRLGGYYVIGRALFIITFECPGATTSPQYVLYSCLSLTVLGCNGIRLLTDVFTAVLSALIHQGWHGRAMPTAHIIKLTTDLCWPMGALRQNTPGSQDFTSKKKHNTFAWS